MANETLTTPTTKPAMVWAGRIVSALAALPFLPSAFFKLSQSAQAVEGFTKLGWPTNTILPLGVAELAGVILYAIPQTAVLGAVVLTGYLGGAIAVHVSQGEGFLVAAVIGVLLWLGLFLRDARIRELIPLRKL